MAAKGRCLSDVVSRLRQGGVSGQGCYLGHLGRQPCTGEALRRADTLNGLRKLGFRTVGELAATPRAPLTLRFGAEV
jgi:hypothetical protein